METPPNDAEAVAALQTRKNDNKKAVAQMPWSLPQNCDAPIEPLSEEGVEAIHSGAMRILEEIGVAFLNQEARDILKTAGCKIEGDLRVHGS